MCELLARLRALERVGNTRGQTHLAVGDLTLDLVRHQARRASQHVALTEREFALLATLMRHPGRPLSRTAIAAEVWDYGFVHHSNVVDVYISHLRRKIDDPFKVKLIQTIRGVGYRIAAPDDET